MKSKKSSPWVGAGIGCLGGAIFSVCAIAAINILVIKSGSDSGRSLIRIISYLPYVTAIAGYIIYKNRQNTDNIQSDDNTSRFSALDLQSKVLELLAKETSTQAIALKLGLSAIQVANIKAELVQKLGVQNESELVAEAKKQGLLPNDSAQVEENR